MEELVFRAEITNKYPWASDYLLYLNYRRLGLKTKSKLALANFVDIFETRTDEEKRAFLDNVFIISFLTSNYNLYLPHNLYTNYFIPTLDKWIMDDPNNFIPYRWVPDFELNKKGVVLNPHDQISILNFSNLLINKISMNQHEIIAGFMYHGNPSKDFELIEFIEPFIGNIEDAVKQKEIRTILLDLKNIAQAHKAKI
jgi:hypothetical protein